LIQDRVSLNLAYFHITEFNVALEQANGFIFQGNRFTSGAEVELRARITQKLNLFASYGYTDASLGNFVVPSYFSGYSVPELSGQRAGAGSQANREGLGDLQFAQGISRDVLYAWLRHLRRSTTVSLEKMGIRRERVQLV
jgi:hypothetical protein